MRRIREDEALAVPLVSIVHIIHVEVNIRPEFIDAFRRATIENARNSVREPGIERFDVLQDASDPSRFLLIEVYRTAEDPARHRETAHYKTWRDTAEPMMAKPRSRVEYHSVFPNDTAA